MTKLPEDPFYPGEVYDILARADKMIKEAEAKIPWTKVRESDELSGWRELKAHHYILPNGEEKAFDISVHSDSTCVLAITKTQEVVLVKQFRPGPENFTLELPGGLVDPGEEAMVGAARELTEETGYSGELQPVGEFWLGAYSTGRKHSYLATNCEWVHEQKTDDDEFIEVVLMPLDEFREWVHTAESATVITAYRALRIYDS